MGLYMENSMAHVHAECHRCGIMIEALNHGPHIHRALARMHDELCAVLRSEAGVGGAEEDGNGE